MGLIATSTAEGQQDGESDLEVYPLAEEDHPQGDGEANKQTIE